MTVSVIIPFHRNLSHLRGSVSAVRRSMPDAEILIAADGAVEDSQAIAAAAGAQVVVIPGPSGPAVARNRAAALASGDILVFVDADVVVAPDALPGMCRLLGMDRDIAGVFGAYDLSPAEPNFMSQYKNLSHAYVHEVGEKRASTFWAGLGALRADAFRSVGGFDERFRRPSIEDIELGYRLIGAGYSLRLEPAFRGTHLKRWTLASSITTDIAARGIPWVQLIHRSRTVANDLNTTIVLRISVLLSVAFAVALLLTPFSTVASVATAALFVALIVVNWKYYRWFARTRGLLFATRVVPVHLIHHLCNAASFVVGTFLYGAARSGLTLRGTLPATIWGPAPRAADITPSVRRSM